MRLKTFHIAIASLATALISSSALAQKKYDPGATDKEIKIGGIKMCIRDRRMTPQR